MSIGKAAMQKVADQLASNVAICDHRGRDFVVMTEAEEFFYGTATPNQDHEVKFAATLPEVDLSFKPFAKKLQKQAIRSNAQEFENELRT